jgi:Flp pilus assembly protein TadB
MSTDATVRPITRGATAVETAGDESRTAEYRARIDVLRRAYKRRARRNGVAANCVSLLLVAAGAAVGLSPLLEGFRDLTAVLGVSVILLEGVTRVLRPALRAARAGRVARKLEREFRLYDVCGRGYRCGGAEADAAFVTAVERILEQADAAEEHDETGTSDAPTSPRKAG